MINAPSKSPLVNDAKKVARREPFVYLADMRNDIPIGRASSANAGTRRVSISSRRKLMTRFRPHHDC